MSRRLRKVLLTSSVFFVLLSFGAFAVPSAYQTAYAAQEESCSCSADCLIDDCDCEGERFCACFCYFLEAKCACDELVEQ